MDDKSGEPQPFPAPAGPSFYRSTDAPVEGVETLDSLPASAGPWSPDAQHGGAPAALLARALEGLPDASGRHLGRFTMELLGPVPVGPLEVRAEVLRPGRSVALVGCELVDLTRGRAVASARGWLFPHHTDGPAPTGVPLPHSPADGVSRPRPESWSGGYLDAVQWRWISGGLEEPGVGTVWMRPPAIVAGEEASPVQRLLACVDSASGVSAALDIREWAFLNTELTVHLLRPPVGEWVCVTAETTLGSGSVGVCTSEVHDTAGLVARSTQALLVVRR